MSVVAMESSRKEGLLFVQVNISGGCFLVDTGAEAGIFLATRTITPTAQPGALLVAANGR